MFKATDLQVRKAEKAEVRTHTLRLMANATEVAELKEMQERLGYDSYADVLREAVRLLKEAMEQQGL